MSLASFIEPSALDGEYAGPDHVNASIAISLKRIADGFDKMREPHKSTSPEMAAKAAAYVSMSDDQMASVIQGGPVAAFFEDVRSLAGSVLSQTETNASG